MSRWIQGVHHIAIATESIAQDRPYYEEILKLSWQGEETIEKQQIKVAFFDAGNCKIELVEPLSDKSPISKFLATKGPGIHHIAFQVQSLDQRLQELEEQGLDLIDSKGRPGAHHTQVGFIHPRSTHKVLTELVEEP